MQERDNMPHNDVKQVLELLGNLTVEFKEVKEFLLRHTAKIESIDFLAMKINKLETELALVKQSLSTKNGPNYRESIQLIAWLLTFALLLFQTFFK